MLQMLYASDLCFYRLKFKQSLGISSAIEKLRYDFLNIKAEIEEWGGNCFKFMPTHGVY